MTNGKPGPDKGCVLGGLLVLVGGLILALAMFASAGWLYYGRRMSQRRPALLAILPALVLAAGVLVAPGLVRADRGERDLARSGMGARFDVLAATIESNARAEVVKRRLPGLLQSAPLQDPRQADTVGQRIVQAVDRLRLSAGQTERLLSRLEKLDPAQLDRLVQREGNGVLAYGQSVVSAASPEIGAIKATLARGADGAGLDAVRLVRRLEEGAPVSREALVGVLERLPPGKSTALLEAVRSELRRANPAQRPLLDSVGTVIDGVLVFDDAISLHQSDMPPEEKVGAATGLAVEQGLEAAGTVLIGAVGGGLGAGLVLGWSAAKVGELTREMIGLHYDRQNAALKEQWARLELREMVIRKLLEVDRLMKGGKLEQARDQARRLREFYAARESLIDDEALGRHLAEARENLGQAERKQSALAYLNEARRPYERALASYVERVNLKQALRDAQEARGILARWVSVYGELANALGQAERLETSIRQAIADATPVTLVRIEGPSRVVVGQWARFHLTASGGVPWYCNASGGACGRSFATEYWQATGLPGVRTLPLAVTDDIGQTAASETSIEVLAASNEEDTAGDERKPGAPSARSGRPHCQRLLAYCARTGGCNAAEVGSWPDARCRQLLALYGM